MMSEDIRQLLSKTCNLNMVGLLLMVNTKLRLRIRMIDVACPQALLGEGKESLVTTACACANPYKQNMVIHQGSLKGTPGDDMLSPMMNKLLTCYHL